METPDVLGADSNHSFQPSFFSITSRFFWVSGGFLERRITGKNGEGTLTNAPLQKHLLSSLPVLARTSMLADVSADVRLELGLGTC